MTPITPAEAKARRHGSIPEYVFQIVNDLLVANLNSSGTAIIQQRTIATAIQSHPEYLALELPRPDIYRYGWLDFEDHYREQGWKVTYDRPAWGEMHPTSYIFKS